MWTSLCPRKIARVESTVRHLPVRPPSATIAWQLHAIHHRRMVSITCSATPPVLPYRVGHGFDLHRLAEGYKLIIGGVDIPHTKGCEAHSDGKYGCMQWADEPLRFKRDTLARSVQMCLY